MPINHVDAGTANLLAIDFAESALIAYAHHIGLQSIPEEQKKEDLFLRDPNLYSNGRMSSGLSSRKQLLSGSTG